MGLNVELSAIIEIADSTQRETRERLGDFDLTSIARHAMQEIAERATHFDSPTEKTAVQLELIAPKGERHAFLLTVGQGEPIARLGRLEGAPVRISQDFGEMLRAIYGTRFARHDATREVWLRNEPGPGTDGPEDPWHAKARAATVAAGQVLSAISPEEVNLGALARRLGTDKWGVHFYTPHYERHFSEYRDQRVNVLEIGVGGYAHPSQGGESLRMWKAYFHRGLIYGLDLHDKSALDRPRIETIQGDQSDAQLLSAIAAEIGPLDIVIDDGSHLSDHVLTSFAALFPSVASGGVYVIEDLQTAYWPGWNGGRSSHDDPRTTTGFLKTLIDALHHQDRITASSPMPPDIEHEIRGIHLYHNIVFIEKGINTEQGAPSWIRRDAVAPPISPAEAVDTDN